MKVIGRVESKFDEEGVPDDLDYLGGYIIQLTMPEASILRGLQEAMDGFGWSLDGFMERKPPRDRNMSPIFEIIMIFTEAKFVINDLKKEVEKIEEILVGLDESAEANLDEQ